MEAIDLYVKNTPSSVTASVQTLANYLIQPAQNDVEKARAVYDWIAMNISYNYNEYLNPSAGGTSAADVLQSRSSICEGYSNLFQTIGTTAGLDVETIDGWGKGIGYSAGDQITEPSNHAWNAVKINGQWYLLDSTWGAGYTDEQNNFVFDFDDEYFLMPPEQFIYTHFPEDAKWQLLSTPISNTEFADLPYVQKKFFSYGLGLDSSLKSIIQSNGDVSFSISAPSNILVRAMLVQGTQELSDTLTFTQRTGNQYQVNAICPNAGDYTLRIYAKQQDNTETYNNCLDFKVTASAGSANLAAFPKAYASFFDNNAFVNTPLNGNLKSGTVQHFNFNIPNTTDVQIVIGNKWTPLTRQGDNFQGDVTLTAGTAQVCAKFPDNTQYGVLLVYTIQ
jgi:transglutaminase/protease-like cytokinesis protein 3